MQSWVCLGIDIGVQTTNFGFVDMNGTCVAEGSVPTHADEPAELHVERLAYAVDAVWDRIDRQFSLEGIGIGAPNANYYTGSIIDPPNLKWGQVPYTRLLSKHYQVPIAITNDANAAALGELQFGAAQGMKDFIAITLGTGLGSGFVSNGDLIYGTDGFAGEIGHSILFPNGRSCSCGRNGCLETYASASGIRRTAVEMMAERTEESELRSLSWHDLTGKVIAEAASHGDQLAIEIFKRTGDYLGLGLSNAVTCTAPEAIILVGGLAKAGNLLLQPVKTSFDKYVFSLWKGKVKITLSGLGNQNVSILGSAALAWKEISGN